MNEIDGSPLHKNKHRWHSVASDIDLNASTIHHRSHDLGTWFRRACAHLCILRRDSQDAHPPTVRPDAYFDTSNGDIPTWVRRTEKEQKINTDESMFVTVYCEYHRATWQIIHREYMKLLGVGFYMLALNQHYYVLDLYEKEVVHFSYDMCESIQVMNIMNAKRQSEHDKSVISCAYNFDLELCMFPGCTRKAQIEAMYQDIGKDELKRTKVCNTHIRYLHNLVKVVATKSIPET